MAYPFYRDEYSMSFDTNNRVQIGEYSTLIPDKPKKDRDFVNYGKADDKQKFERVVIPTDLKSMSSKAQEDFVGRLFHKRKHGVWILVNGQPIYLTGQNFYYLNFWWCESGMHPEFRVCDTQVWQWWRFEICADKNCYGGLVLKSRRIGLTEINLCEIYEYITRVKYTQAGMQNMTDEDAYRDFERIVKAHNKMPFFFKPVNKGSDKPNDGLIFEMPSERATKARIQKEYGMDEEFEENFEPLYSRILFEVTKLEKFDGTRLHRARQGEFGKIRPHVMDVTKRMGVLAPCLHMYNGQVITGKCFWESTTRELGEGEMLERTTQMWNDSDPKKLDGNGRTKSGLKRLFLSAIDTAMPDEYGFPQKENTRKRLEMKFAFLEKAQDWQALSDAQREDPITIAHALTPSIDHCLFNALKLKKRLEQIQANLWWDGNPYDHHGKVVIDQRRRGNFVWEVRDSKAAFVDDPKGKFWVSNLLPKEEANRISYDLGFKSPGNKHLFGCGIDPIDTKIPDGTRHSSPAMALFRKPDAQIDKSCMNEKNEWVKTGNMITGQFWATYCHRPEEPSEFYEDMLMMAVYYGTEVLYERGKHMGIREHFRQRGYWGYLSFRPDTTKTDWSSDKDPGLPSSEGSIEMYIGALSTYIAFFIDNCKHPELIFDGDVGWLTLRNNQKSRGKHDLAVASGIALLHAEQKYEKPNDEKTNDEWFEEYNVMAQR